MSVCLSPCLSVAPTGWISVKFDVGDFHVDVLRRSRFVENQVRAFGMKI